MYQSRNTTFTKITLTIYKNYIHSLYGMVLQKSLLLKMLKIFDKYEMYAINILNVGNFIQTAGKKVVRKTFTNGFNHDGFVRKDDYKPDDKKSLHQ